MTLRLKLNLVLAAIIALALLAACLVVSRAADHARREAAVREAALMTAEADVAARYTLQDVAPIIALIDRDGALFVPQSAPFHAVEAQARMLGSMLPSYALRRVVLDPSGPVDHPSAWERAAIARLRDAPPDHAAFSEEHDDHDGHLMALVTPLRMTEGACATCYPSRQAAPLGVLDAFGANQGFDRKPGEIVGATIATVPIRSMPDAAGTAVAWLAVIMLAVWGALAAVVEYVLLRPLERLAATADRISLGQSGVPEFETETMGDLGIVARAFNRLRRSMETAIAAIEA